MSLSKLSLFNIRSIRVRLTVIFTAIFGTTLILFSVFQYQVFVRTHQGEFDAALFNYAVDFTQGIDLDFFGNVLVHLDAITAGDKIFPFSSAFVEVRSSDGNGVWRSRNLGHSQLPFVKDDIPVLSWRGAIFRTLDAKSFTNIQVEQGTRYRMIAYLVEKPAVPKLILQIAVPLSFLEHEGSNLMTFLIISVPVTLLLAALGGLYLSRRALAPVAAIIEKAKNIDVTELSGRVPVPQVDDELRALALTLNELLDRLQQSFESQERFVADASHQLKTPLAILRGELDLMRSLPRDQAEIADFLSSASQEINHLTRMVEDLLLLARVDAGKGALSIQKIRIDELTLEAVSRLEQLAARKGVKIRLNLVGGNAEAAGENFEIEGDPGLYQCMVQNLIENAIKFSPTEGRVEVTLFDDSKTSAVTVKDEGPGIPAEARARIFERFFRGEATKSAAPGFGLGLPIARRIAELHGGSLTLESSLGEGATFEFRIRKD